MPIRSDTWDKLDIFFREKFDFPLNDEHILSFS